MVNQCKAANMHLTVALVEVGSVAEEEAVAVAVAVIIDVRKVQKPKIAVVVKVSMILNQRRNHVDRVVATTEVVEVAEDEEEVDVVVIDVAQERVAKDQEMNRGPMVMITTKGIVTRDVMEEEGEEVIQGDVHEDSEDAQGVLLHKVQETKEAVIVIMTVVVINIKKINEETETIGVATEVTVVIVVIVVTGVIVVIVGIVTVVIATVVTVIVVIATVVTVIVVIGIGMVTVMVKDQEEVDMDVSERIQKVRTVMPVARKKVAYAKSPTKWKKLRLRVENQQP